MSIIGKLFKKQPRRVVVLGFDGTPFSFMERMKKEGKLPTLSRLFDGGSLRRMNSVHPCVSCVAWSSVMTGKNPGKHGIFGFADRRPGTYDVYIPNGKDLRSKILPEILSDHGKRVVNIGVPVTFPPREVNGYLVSCFLTPAIEKGTHPKEFGQYLKDMGYIIDVDAQKARTNLDGFFPDLMKTLEKRAEAAHYLLEKEKWDFFLVHFMETDRLHHFVWEYMETEHEKYAPLFHRFYERLDEITQSFLDRLDDDVVLIILSDHGFCTIKQELYLNHWLEGMGYLSYGASKTMNNVDWGRTQAFCMDPGRVYLNVRGREPQGIVSSGREYNELRDKLAGELAGLADPASGEAMVRTVFTNQEIFHGGYAHLGPDLVLDPHWGYDVKGFHGREALTGKGPINGMHTFEDAMLYIRGEDVKGDGLSVIDFLPTVFGVMNVPVPSDVDGRDLIAG
jgi:predicted AlkP superfamily phosphohydrolase/phosphomutase